MFNDKKFSDLGLVDLDSVVQCMGVLFAVLGREAEIDKIIEMENLWIEVGDNSVEFFIGNSGEFNKAISHRNEQKNIKVLSEW